MSADRRSFLRNMALGSGAIATGAFLTSCASEEKLTQIKAAASRQPAMNFNMSGYAAPALDTCGDWRPWGRGCRENDFY